MATEKRKKRGRGRPPEHDTDPIPDTFENILKTVVRTVTQEEIDAVLGEEKHDKDKSRGESDVVQGAK